MRVLVLGGAGMLGHKLCQVLSRKHDVHATFRKSAPMAGTALSRIQPHRAVDVREWKSVVDLVQRLRPEAVINCVGIVKQLEEARDPILSIAINALLPHQLAALCSGVGARLIHISTDCVFSGERGSYTEADNADPHDLYGRTKLLGEVVAPGCVTLRTSIIGHELGTHHGLVEWFLQQESKSISGFKRAIYTGLPTVTLAGVIDRLLADHRRLEGLYHVASSSISKYDLLHLLRDAYGLDVTIAADSSFACDRSLVGTRFREATGITLAPWEDLVAEMRADFETYGKGG